MSYIKIAPLHTLDCIKRMSIGYRDNLGISDRLRRTAYDAIFNIKLQISSSRVNSVVELSDRYFGSLGFYEFRQLK